MYKGERVNSISHLIGLGLSIAGLIVLLVHVVPQHNVLKTFSFSIYGATLVALYFFSTLYHSVRGKVKAAFQKGDHAAIYLLIAGTYTPFTLVTLHSFWGWWLFGTVWGLAFFGMLQDSLFKKRRRNLSVTIYLVMGWLAVFALRPLARTLPVGGLSLLVSGGLCYTVGVVFYVLDRKLSYGHAIFHLFVLAGSACHYFSILLFVV
jgi:hemolysin III